MISIHPFSFLITIEMKGTIMSKYEDMLDESWTKHSAFIDKVALLAYVEVIEPFCVRRGLKFLAGNGECTFHLPEHKNGHRVETWDVEDDEEFIAIFELCHTYVLGLHMNDLGSMMPSFYP